MEVHQKNVGGNERIAGTMFRYFRFPKDFSNFVYLSQIQQGLAIKTAVEYWRSLKPHCMGTIIWQLNDTWPVASWASLDYGGNWKSMHYQARRFFAPVALFAIPSKDGRTIEMSMVNDLLDNTEVSAEFYTVGLDGTRRPLKSARATCRPDKAMVLATIDAAEIGPDRLLFWDFHTSAGTEGRGHHLVSTYKALDLEDAGLGHVVSKQADGTWSIALSSKGLSLFVSIEANCPGRFSDNAFDMLAGENRTITFTPEEDGAKPSFVVRDLHSCQATE
jgi:beta-mannosidase